MLVNNTNKTDNFNKSGVYEKSCDDNCNIGYIGCTRRSFKLKITEHKNSMHTKRNSTGFSKHCIDFIHTFSENNLKCLHNIKKDSRLDLLQQLHI